MTALEKFLADIEARIAAGARHATIEKLVGIVRAQDEALKFYAEASNVFDHVVTRDSPSVLSVDDSVRDKAREARARANAFAEGKP